MTPHQPQFGQLVSHRVPTFGSSLLVLILLFPLGPSLADSIEIGCDKVVSVHSRAQTSEVDRLVSAVRRPRLGNQKWSRLVFT